MIRRAWLTGSGAEFTQVRDEVVMGEPDEEIQLIVDVPIPDSDWTALLAWSCEQVARAYWIPPELMGGHLIWSRGEVFTWTDPPIGTADDYVPDWAEPLAKLEQGLKETLS